MLSNRLTLVHDWICAYTRVYTCRSYVKTQRVHAFYVVARETLFGLASRLFLTRGVMALPIRCDVCGIWCTAVCGFAHGVFTLYPCTLLMRIRTLVVGSDYVRVRIRVNAHEHACDEA